MLYYNFSTFYHCFIESYKTASDPDNINILLNWNEDPKEKSFREKCSRYKNGFRNIPRNDINEVLNTDKSELIKRIKKLNLDTFNQGFDSLIRLLTNSEQKAYVTELLDQLDKIDTIDNRYEFVVHAFKTAIRQDNEIIAIKDLDEKDTKTLEYCKTGDESNFPENFISITDYKNATSKEDIEILDTDIGSLKFIESCLKKDIPIKSIKMAFHVGWLWLRDEKRIKLLIDLLENKKINIQVISNPESIINEIASSMQDPEYYYRYPGYNRAIDEWSVYDRDFDTLSFRISNKYPIFRRSIIVEYENGFSEAMILHYTYGKPARDSSPHIVISNTDSSFEYYKTEYEYLFNNSITYDEWHSLLVAEDIRRSKTIDFGTYALFFLNHKKIDEDTLSSKWIRADLELNEDRSSKLHNIRGFNDLGGSSNSSISGFDYSYDGNFKIGTDYITIFLFDNKIDESICITLFRASSGSIKKRYVGILSSYSPMSGFLANLKSPGQPASFKCACIKEAIPDNIDTSLVENLFQIKAKEENENLITITDDELRDFYDDLILYKKKDQEMPL